MNLFLLFILFIVAKLDLVVNKFLSLDYALYYALDSETIYLDGSAFDSSIVKYYGTKASKAGNIVIKPLGDQTVTILFYQTLDLSRRAGWKFTSGKGNLTLQTYHSSNIVYCNECSDFQFDNLEIVTDKESLTNYMFALKEPKRINFINNTFINYDTSFQSIAIYARINNEESSTQSRDNSILTISGNSFQSISNQIAVVTVFEKFLITEDSAPRYFEDDSNQLNLKFFIEEGLVSLLQIRSSNTDFYPVLNQTENFNFTQEKDKMVYSRTISFFCSSIRSCQNSEYVGFDVLNLENLKNSLNFNQTKQKEINFELSILSDTIDEVEFFRTFALMFEISTQYTNTSRRALQEESAEKEEDIELVINFKNFGYFMNVPNRIDEVIPSIEEEEVEESEEEIKNEQGLSPFKQFLFLGLIVAFSVLSVIIPILSIIFFVIVVWKLYVVDAKANEIELRPSINSTVSTNSDVIMTNQSDLFTEMFQDDSD